MNPPPTQPENDVSRLLRQLQMDSFQFRSFSRSGDDEREPADSPRFPLAPAPSHAVMRAPGERPVERTPPVAEEGSLNAAFDRLAQKAPARRGRGLSFRLNLPLRPCAQATLRPAPSLLSDVFSSLLRQGANEPEIRLINRKVS